MNQRGRRLQCLEIGHGGGIPLVFTRRVKRGLGRCSALGRENHAVLDSFSRQIHVPVMPQQEPQIVDDALDDIFRAEVIKYGWDADDPWIGGYLSVVWKKDRWYIASFLGDIQGKLGLEFGCNVGASAILLSRLGARVTAVDADRRYVRIAELNARRYGETAIQFKWIPAGTTLPYSANSFDFVTCASVLEYVSPQHLSLVIKEIDRLLIPGGILLVLGTRNRLAPREVHSRRWLSNYIPIRWDRRLGHRQRGIFPWQITRNLRDYVDLVKNDKEKYFSARKKAGDGRAKIGSLRIMAATARLLGLSCGAVTPSFFLALRKHHADRSASRDNAAVGATNALKSPDPIVYPVLEHARDRLIKGY
jgi:2-polyprenyl-3-methyl-5-hydroxy-6-metoxy-1,4-benzoquinol methylase